LLSDELDPNAKSLLAKISPPGLNKKSGWF
jgi:hypothetical protein